VLSEHGRRPVATIRGGCDDVARGVVDRLSLGRVPAYCRDAEAAAMPRPASMCRTTPVPIRWSKHNLAALTASMATPGGRPSHEMSTRLSVQQYAR
jgi:hypothetical protein